MEWNLQKRKLETDDLNEEKLVKYDELLERFREILRVNGLKQTQQRENILHTIYGFKGHFTPEDLYAKVQKTYPDQKIGIATIYRTLSLLESEKIVTSISFGVSGKKFEFGIREHHDHMICDRCGKMIEFMDETIEKRQNLIAKRYNFLISGHMMQIHGVCENCQQKESKF